MKSYRKVTKGKKQRNAANRKTNKKKQVWILWKTEKIKRKERRRKGEKE